MLPNFWLSDVRLLELRNQPMCQNQTHLDAIDTFCGNTRVGGEMDWGSKLTPQMGFHWLSREGDIWRPVKDGELNKGAFTSTPSRKPTS